MKAPLADSFGRTIGDLRISVTDRCNFRCTYCIPEENVSWLDSGRLLSFAEIERLTRILVSRGIRKLRLTGGEPLLRPHLDVLAKSLSAIEGVDDVALTTNGRLFADQAERLRAAGIRRVNISLDSLRRERFAAITKRDELQAVLEAIEAAERAGFAPVRINAVLIRGVNDDEVLDFARFARESGHSIRFIEFMPLDSGHRWTRDQVVPASEVIEMIGSVFPLMPIVGGASETARRYAFTDAPGEIGLIAPVSAPFCGNCNRLRLTADGQLRTCLFATSETDLRTPLRAGASDDDLEAIIAGAVFGKQRGHGVDTSEYRRASRTMSAIGG